MISGTGGEINDVANSGISKETGSKPTGESSSSDKNLTFTVNGVTFEMVYVQGGSFNMGCTNEQSIKCPKNEMPTHRVKLTDFYIGKFEVTQKLWNAVMDKNKKPSPWDAIRDKNPSKWKGDNLPVERVSWDDCQIFIGRLSDLTGKQFRLPTEAQWEYAARGGAKSSGYRYSGGHDIFNVAWSADNSGGRTHEVGSLQPNELGIYDMSGNVCEWCYDWFDIKYYDYSPENSPAGPAGPSSGSNRVLRAGGAGTVLRKVAVCRTVAIVPSNIATVTAGFAWRFFHKSFQYADDTDLREPLKTLPPRHIFLDPNKSVSLCQN
jgi:formylglycine-generating enzyme required for sulfatase activity